MGTIVVNVWMVTDDTFRNSYFEPSKCEYNFHQIELRANEDFDLEEFFAIGNGHASKGSYEDKSFNTEAYYYACERSFSVSDAVAIKLGYQELIFRCASVGWEEITPDHKDYALFTTARIANGKD